MAKMRRYVTFSTAADVELPKLVRHCVKMLSRSELDHFLTQASTEPDGPLFELYATTGLRRGELPGLRWSDIDLDARILSVRQLAHREREQRLRPELRRVRPASRLRGLRRPEDRGRPPQACPFPKGWSGALMVRRLSQGEMRAEHGEV